MATITATLPPMGAALTETSSVPATTTTGLPALTTHLSIGVTIPPPALTGTAVLRGLAGTATVT